MERDRRRIGLAVEACGFANVFEDEAPGSRRSRLRVRVFRQLFRYAAIIRTARGAAHLVWNIRGHVIVRIVNTGGVNAVVSGLFCGPWSSRRSARRRL
jgi:hypothetical protein